MPRKGRDGLYKKNFYLDEAKVVPLILLSMGHEFIMCAEHSMED